MKELHSRNKVGSINDRRFGENDPTMTPEERAAERFARESQRKFRKESMFNLEEDEGDDEMQLTHLGESLSFGGKGDDFAEDLDAGQSDDDDDDAGLKRKRMAPLDEVDDMEGLASDDENEEEPLRKRSKAEVMKEVIAKSKLHKFERQKTKEEDDELRAELDQGLPDLFDLMRGIKPAPKPETEPQAASGEFGNMDPARAALLQGKNKGETDAEYDKRLKQMMYDKRSQPTDRTKTEEEKAQEDAARLKALEVDRLRRMRGEDSEAESEQAGGDDEVEEENADFVPDDAKAFGLGYEEQVRPELGVEDEDEFVIDEDLVETDSNASLSFIQSDEEEEEEEEESESDDELMKEFADSSTETKPLSVSADPNTKLAYTYPCPGSHEELLAVLKDVPVNDIPVVIQRIRALYHPRLNAENKAKLGRFSQVLVEHVAYMASQKDRGSFTVIENMLRHIHSMAKSNPEPVAHAFREHLRKMSSEQPLNLQPGDLAILTGVMTVFPTSDHFHAVVTPANLCIARYLGLSAIKGVSDLATGAYLATLCLQFQSLAKRFVPEFVNYCLSALSMLSPTEIKQSLGPVFLRTPEVSLRLVSTESAVEKLKFWDVIGADISPDTTESVKASLMELFVTLLDSAATLWSSNKTAFIEIFHPAQTVLKQLQKASLPPQILTKIGSTLTHLTTLSKQSRRARRPLLLHNHRPLAIKTSIPKFEEDFNPDRHYDPNRERAELSRLRAEHKRERKGAMRELRKDANFVARESLREKKERDAAYEKKYKRLVAEIQGEEGREAKAYDRERKWRTGKK